LKRLRKSMLLTVTRITTLRVITRKTRVEE
jgi:hypothetical protein